MRNTVVIRSTAPVRPTEVPFNAARGGAALSPWRRLWRREPRLVAFTLLLLALLLPAVLALGLDERTLRGVNVWIKPIKFLLSVALFASTTAWFIGHLPPARRRGTAVRTIVWTVIACGGFEIAYIGLQAALGQASHYNVGDPLHAALYALMGIGALALTATQPVLAWQIARHAEPALPDAYRLAVVIGLVLTFVLGAGAGGLLSSGPPAAGPGLPLLGWSTSGGDLRVAHFIGIHSAQVLPAIGWWLSRDPSPFPAWARRAAVWTAALLWTALFAAALAMALAGRPLIAA